MDYEKNRIVSSEDNILSFQLKLTIRVEIVYSDSERIRKDAPGIACSVWQRLAQAQSASLSPDLSDIGDDCRHSGWPNADIEQDQLDAMTCT